MRSLKPLLNTLTLALATLVSALPLSAQVNPKWQTLNSPDFMDLYQRSSSTKVKPEIATVFDFSGSMAVMMFHKDYKNDNLSDNASDDCYIQFTVTYNATAGRYNCTASLIRTADAAAPYGTALSGDIPGSILTGNDSNLVRPDGTLVTAASVNGTNTTYGDFKDSQGVRSGDVRNWIMACSHIRLTYNGRTVDLPAPWKIMDASSTGYPLSSLMCPDPVVTVTNPDDTTRTYGSGTDIEMDRSYRAAFASVFTSQGNATRTVGTTTVTFRNRARLSGFCDYRQDYLSWIFNAKVGFPSTIPTIATAKAFANGIPARTRVQAVKEAAIKTWVKYQDSVVWAFRFLNPGQVVSNSYVYGENGSNRNVDTETPNSINRDSRNPISTSDTSWTDDPTTSYVTGRSRVWTMLNNTQSNPNNSVNGMNVIASLFASSNTPLTFALANTLAQFSDPNSVFNDYYNSPGNSVYDCGNHCVILFTDGIPNNEGSTNKDTQLASPYISATTLIGDANMGNAGMGAPGSKSTTINRDATNWNISNFAAIAAHGVLPSGKTNPELTTYWSAPASYPASGAPSLYIPFAITSRNGTTFKAPHPVQVMTVGISLGGDLNSTSGGKRRLFQAACFGDPKMTSWNLNNLKAFYQVNPADPDSPKASDAVYFFDVPDPDALVTALEQAFKAAAASQQTASTSVPVIPWIGGGLSRQVYLAAFTVPEGGGPAWDGDLMMFPTKDVTLTDPITGAKTQTLVLDANGTEVTGDLMAVANPGWSAKKALVARGWQGRTIYTRPVSTATVPNPPILAVSTGVTTTDFGTGKPLTGLVPGVDAAAKLKNLQWMMGADTSATSTPYPTRSNIMGDVLNSAPSFLEYSNPSSLPGALGTAWSDSGKINKHFRVLFVGTNQGVLHAFGEVTWDKTIGTGATATTIKAGVVEELWAFIPTDIIQYCDHYTRIGDPHYFGVDGSPYLYFLDLPASGKRSGNGMLDIGSNERATLIVGLGKGGRSYYALDVRNPLSPQLGGSGNKGWALVPDEETSFPESIFDTSTKDRSVIRKMGWSTCQPTVGRVLSGTGTTQVIKDVVFLGGGFSLPEIEKNFPTADANTRLGRSVLALDVDTGHVAAYWDLSASTGVGPVGAGVMPMQVVPYSGLTQRAYFTDFHGGLWALGSTASDPRSDYTGFRVDSSSLNAWATTARPVFHQDTPNGFMSTIPAPFLVSNFYPRTTAPFVTPQTVGVTLVTGDRNNPMDQLYTGASSVTTKPDQHRLVVVFDRQDSNKLGLDTTGIQTSQLADMSTQTDPNATAIQPGSSDFYLNSKYGYYINFPTRTNTQKYVAKGLITPIVLSGKLFYSYFSPLGYADDNPCNNGTGSTSTVEICNVMTPTFPGVGVKWSADKRVMGCASGEIFTWTGLASRFSPKSILAAMQAGMLVTGSGSDATPPALKVKAFEGDPGKAFAGPKVWRSVR